MTVPPESAGTLARGEKQQLLRKILLEKIGRTRTAPTSFAQERLWFIDRLEPGSAVYNIPVAWRLEGALDVAALERALGEIVRRHEALRTTFGEADGSPVQVIAPFRAFALPVEDLSGLGEADREATVERRAGEEARRAFDLSAGPLFRAALLRLGAEEHVLLLSVHHVVGDGGSLGVLYGELSALYEAYREGRTSPLPELAVQYVDYALWQREHLRDGVLEEQLAYWRERLADAPALLELPTDHPRPAVQTFRGAHEQIELPLELLERLQALGRSEGATLYMVLLGAFQVLLGKYSGSDDIVVGSPITGRTRKEFEETIGFFVNTLVLRTDVSGDPGFRELLGRVREVTLGAYEHQEVPFERLVAELQPERSLSHSPLFQVMFVLQNAVERGVALPGLEASEVGAELESAKFDLTLLPRATDQGLRVGLSYSTALFERGTAVRMLGHLARVLEQVAADADVRLSRLELLGEAERALVLEAWNDTAAEVPADRCIHELFEAQAARTPDAPALVFEGRTLTYAELNARANRLARRLVALGVRPESIVALALERSGEMVVALLAVNKAGAAFLPVDPAYPAERRRWMLEQSAAPLVLTTSALAADLPETRASVVALDLVAAEIEAEDDGDLSVDVDLQNAAYVIFTSGSTGRPKGVVVPHRGIGNLAAAQREAFGVEPGGRVLQFASFSFDAAVAEVAHTLLGGAALVMARADQAGPELLALLRGEAVTVATLPPSLLAALPADELPALRTVVSAGEAVSADVVARWGAGRRFVNAYGPTETTVCATVSIDPPAGGRPPIGRPIANVRAYVLDARMQPVPVGVPGELYVGGMGVARGYLGQPGQTAERFVPDAFGGEAGGRLYRTGDLGRWRPDGTIEFLGRSDFQVKIRGFRVELGEIEARLAEHPGVREAVVVAREDAAGDRRLAAYYTSDAVIEIEPLRAHLGARLPEHMVPAAYVHLDALPLTPNGKVDRKALPAPEGDAYARRGYEAPVGETERALAEIWSELLGVEQAGRWDHFFELGGHSLLAVRVVSRVRQVLGAEVGIADLFVHPVLADLARAIGGVARTELPPIEPADRQADLPLSFAQQRLWFIDQLEGAGAAYHMSTRLRLRGELDRAALVRALDRIVARHEALRTVFPASDGVPAQRIVPVEESRFHLAEHDLGGDPGAQSELWRLLGEEARAPFDLARGPLIRGRLIRLAEDDHVLRVTMHHIVSDGWSMGVFTRELSALYAAFHRGEPDPLPPLPVQYADYAAWQRRWVDGGVLQPQAEYWRETLAGAPELLELPADRARPVKQDFTGASVDVELDEALAAALKTLSQRHGTTLFMTLLAGWAAVLARLSGQDEVVVGTPTANRGRSEIEGLIGFFVNTLALRVDLSGSPGVAELLGRVKDRSLGAQHHQDIPFEQVVELVQPTRSRAHSPLFQVMFAWQNAPGGSLELPGLALGPLDPEGFGDSSRQVSAKFDLSLALREEGGRIRGVVDYATALFDRATVERHVGYLRRVLEEMVADDAKPVDRLELLSAAERRRVVEEWNATDAAYPAEACVHELFEAEAARAPSAVAVSFEGERLTYAELNARANRVAHHLRALGVGPEVRVAVCVRRGLETVVALLAVLKAGGGYVPLDPGHPDDRIRYALSDSAPAALLTGGPFVARFAGAGVPLVDLGDPAAWGAYPASDPDRAEVGVGPEHLAYVIYTSGSTGRPKGVLVRHGSLVNLLAVTRAEYGVGPGDVLPALASTAFDISLFELLLPLVSGAEVRLAMPQRVMDARALLSEIADATLLSFVPAVMREIVQVERRAQRLTRVRATFVGGEQVPADLLAEMGATFPAARTYVVYGPTEAAVLASSHEVPADGAVAGYPIGRPLPNVRLYVCDALGEPQPVGVVGELLIGGVGVARGYLGRPALTAERFVPDPFSAVPGARLYRTGDRVRWKESGVLDFLGRGDFQVKIRGFRIETGEIEARLRQHPAVRQAVVLAREDAPGRKRLVAYVVGEAPADALKAYLEARLPGYMVPGAYVRLEALPLTPNGKLDRGALPAPEGAAFARRGIEPPTSMTEQVLADIWAELLGVERVGRRDHFFDLGGHSLLAVRLVSRVREALNPAATVEDVFAYPTLYHLAARLQESGEWFGPTRAIPVRETGSERPLFLMHDVMGVVYYAQILRPHLDPEIPVYALPGPLNDPDELDSLDDLVTRLVRMMTEVQPEGPYRMAGWSAGGAFAYAAAERLIAAGRAVEFVGLLDAGYPSPTNPELDTPLERQLMVLEVLARDSGEARATPEAILALRADAQGLDMPAFIAECKARALLPETVTVARAEQVESRIALLQRSHAEYVPGPLPVSIHIFASDDGNDPRRGWQELPGGAPFRLVRVPGQHHTMWQKGNVEVLGATLSREVRASAASGG